MPCPYSSISPERGVSEVGEEEAREEDRTSFGTSFGQPGLTEASLHLTVGTVPGNTLTYAICRPASIAGRCTDTLSVPSLSQIQSAPHRAISTSSSSSVTCQKSQTAGGESHHRLSDGGILACTDMMTGVSFGSVWPHTGAKISTMGVWSCWRITPCHVSIVQLPP